MDKQIIVDGHIYNLNSIGLYEPEDEYQINDDEWLFQDGHEGFTLVTKVSGDVTIPYMLSNGVDNRLLLNEWWVKHYMDRPDGYELGIIMCGDSHVIGGCLIWGEV